MSIERLNVTLSVERSDGSIARYFLMDDYQVTLRPNQAAKLTKTEADSAAFKWSSSYTNIYGWRVEITKCQGTDLM